MQLMAKINLKASLLPPLCSGHRDCMAPWVPEFDPTDTAAGRDFLERLTTDAALLQRELLTEVLKRNAHTEYLRRFLLLPDGGLPPDGDLLEAFKKRVPVSCYDDIKPYVQRVASGGEPSSGLLCSEPITHLLKSSGTSGGQQKIFPSTTEELERQLYFHGVLALVRNMHLHGDLQVQEGMGMRLTFIYPAGRTASGLTVQAATSAYYHSTQFQERQMGSLDRCTSPLEAILCPDGEQSMYCQLLCGLLHRDAVDHVGAAFANTLVGAIKFLEHNWEEMCADIRTGSLSGHITHAPMRHAVEQRLRLRGPDPALAGEVASECAAKPWDGIVARLWPQARYALTIVTGSMAQYIPILRTYCGARLPLVSPWYASTECAAGVNLRPLVDPPSSASFALLPNIAYFEFAEIQPPHHDERSNGDSGEMKKLVDVQVGRSYELVVTTFAGLYRYRLDDHLTVSGFYNATPLFHFSGRRDVALSIDDERISEEELLRAISQATKLHLSPQGYMLSGSTSFADISDVPGHYVMFWEMMMTSTRSSNKVAGDIPDQTVMENCCSAIEQCFNQTYCQLRESSAIAALEIRVLEQGAFDALMEFFVSRGTSASQYKTPTAIRSKEAMMVLDKRVVGRFFSKEIPASCLYDD